MSENKSKYKLTYETIGDKLIISKTYPDSPHRYSHIIEINDEEAAELVKFLRKHKKIPAFP